jgi:hypothetical protein
MLRERNATKKARAGRHLRAAARRESNKPSTSLLRCEAGVVPRDSRGSGQTFRGAIEEPQWLSGTSKRLRLAPGAA